MKEFINKIHIGNCVDIMNQFPDESIDLTVTSPPYGNLRTYKGYEFDFVAIAQQLYRVTKPGGVVVWVVGDQVINGSESGTSFRQALQFIELGFNLHDTMIYDTNCVRYPDSTRYHQVFEYMFIFSKGKPETINLIQDHKKLWTRRWGQAKNRLTTGELINSNSFLEVDKSQTKFATRFNIWRYASGSGFSTKDKFAFQHPAMFPEKLAADHIISWSNPGDIVLDPMCGSGTTCKMAKINSRNFIGIDISEEYVKISRRRIEVQSMHPLFA